MVEERELHTIETSEETPFVEVELREPAASSRVNSLVAARQRAHAADLMKAHVALMEKEVILPKQVELFRLVNRHYRA